MSKRKRSSKRYNASYSELKRADKSMKRMFKGGYSGPPVAYNLNKRTGGFIGLENKFADYGFAVTTVSNVWTSDNPTTVDCISAVAQGDSENERDGRVYHINSIHLKGIVGYPHLGDESTVSDDDVMRVVVVIDSQTNGAEVTATEVMDDSGTDFLSFRNLQFTSRFKVLYDETFRLNPLVVADGAGANNFNSQGTKLPFTFNKKFKIPIRVTCKGTTAVVGSIVDNSIHVLACSNTGVCTLQYQSRVRFSG